MKYLMLIYGNEAAMQAAREASGQQMIAAYEAYTQAMIQAGAMVGGERLRPSSAATTVRIADGKTQVLDGPYAETKEQLGGYYVIEAADLDAALSWAERCREPPTAPSRFAPSGRCDQTWSRTAVIDPAGTAEAVARTSYGKLIAFLAARTGDVAGAEDALSDAFATALSDWPLHGTPDNPQAWLLTVARRKHVDAVRRTRTTQRAGAHLRLLTEELASETAAGIPDERLALMFVCAHPAIDPAVRAPLMLQTVVGLDAATIASAFLAAPAAVGQRLVRAKARIKLAGIPFRLPDRADLPNRLAAVLDAIYAAYTSGWTDPAGTDVRRRDLALEAIWLCRLVVSLMPDEPEALGLLALLLYAESRRPARRTPDGDYVPLDQQDTALWETAPIRDAEKLLLRASKLGRVGRFQLEAAVQSAHAIRRLTGRADWPAIKRLYDALSGLTGSPVVAINRAVALAETMGASEGLAALNRLAADPRLTDYQPYWAARAGLLARTGAREEASAAYQRAIGLEPDPAVRRFLTGQLAALN